MKTYAARAIVAAAVCATPVMATDALADVYITNFTYGGSGCPQGTASVDLSPDSTSFTVIFDAFIAQIGPGIPDAESRRNCQINLVLRSNQSLRYAVTSASYAGFAHLVSGATAAVTGSFEFLGFTPRPSRLDMLHGPIDAPYVLRDEIAPQFLSYSPCGREAILHLEAGLRVNRGTSAAGSNSYATLGDQGKATYVLSWQRCE